MWIKFAANPFNIRADDIGVPRSTPTIEAGIGNVIQIMIMIIGMLAVVFLIYGGLQFAASDGNSKRIQDARNTILYSVIGLVLAISAFAIVSTITTYVK
jgi:hypothetical protein